MTAFDRSKKKAIKYHLPEGRTTGRDTKYANPYYEGTEGWTNVHCGRKHFMTVPKYLLMQGARACQQPRHQPLPSRHPQ